MPCVQFSGRLDERFCHAQHDVAPRPRRPVPRSPMAPAAADGRARQRPTVGVLEVVGARCRTTSRAGYFSFLGAAHHPSVARLGCRAAGGSPDEWRRGRRGQRRPRRHRRAGARPWRDCGGSGGRSERWRQRVKMPLWRLGRRGLADGARVLIVAERHCRSSPPRPTTVRDTTRAQDTSTRYSLRARRRARKFSPVHARTRVVGRRDRAPARQARGVVDRRVFGAGFTDLGFNGPGRMLFKFNLP